jgi:hypothetical protein
MESRTELSVCEGSAPQVLQKVNVKAALPAVTIALWAAIFGVAAYFLTGAGS